MSIRFTRRLAAVAATTALAISGLVTAPAAHARTSAEAIYHDPSPAQTIAYIHSNAAKPYMGWSSWSLQSTNYPGINRRGSFSWLTAAHVLKQAAAVKATLKSHGYDYINIDAGWWRKWDWTPEYDQYGRPAVDHARFPNGIEPVIAAIHKMGLKVGIYLPVGMEKGAYDNGDFPIYGAPGCTTHSVVYPDLRTTNAWDSSYKLDFSNPCSQYYLDSIAHEFAAWGIDFFKMDGVGPGSEKDNAGPNYDNTQDVQAWATALAGSGRAIHFEVSWALNHNDIATWQRWTNGWRISIDVECYCDTLTQWAPNPTGNKNSVLQRFSEAPEWAADAGPGGWNDFDSLDVGNGRMDGLTKDERQTYMTLWAASAAPLFTGDEVSKLDTYGKSLLTNDEVIAIDQAGVPARPVSQSTPQQVWSAQLPDGSYVVALFNLADTAAPVTATMADLGISGLVSVRDVWHHSRMRVSSPTLTQNLPAHGSALFRVRSI